MANFDNLKQKFKEAAGVIADASVELYKSAEEKTKVLAKTAKLQAENAADRTAIRRLYTEIGKAYYDANRENPAEPYAQFVTEITVSLERIAGRETEIAVIKAASAVTDADVEDAEDEPVEMDDDAE